MRRDNYKIFSTGKIANLNLKNRIVRSATADIPITLTGNVPDEVVDYYRILTRGGAGMIITGDFPVSKDGAL
ncbi:MAG: NADH:flavin oxidoreductase, partial [candidate division WOR-3 bacterium]